MAFPDDLLDAAVEIYLNGGWRTAGTFATPGRLHQDTLVIPRGRQDEASQPAPASVTIILDNADGTLTPKDPRSPYWPTWRKGTQLRIKVDTDIVFWGEVSEIRPRWPIGDAGDIATVEVVASGLLRRVGQHNKPLRSALYREITNPTNLPHLFDYFPFEDGTDATRVASGIPGRTRTALNFAGLQMASDNTLAGSDALPTVSANAHANWLAQHITGFSGHGVIEIVGFKYPTLPTSPAIFRPIDITCTGTLPRWLVEVRLIDSIPVLRVRALTPDGVDIFESTTTLEVSPLWFTPNSMQLRFEMTETSGHVHWTATWWDITRGTDAGETVSDTWAGTFGTVTSLAGLVDQTAGGATLGHTILHDGITAGWLVGPDVGRVGEAATDRVTRLCAEEGYPLVVVVGDDERSMAMGPQQPATISQLLQDCHDADFSLFTEQRNAFGFRLVPRRARYNLVAVLTLDAAQSQIAAPFEPTDDDAVILNDVTAHRTNGTSARVIDQESIDEDGLYDDEITRNIDSDLWVRHVAGWHMHLGQVDGLRYADIIIDLAICPELIPTWKTLNEGDRVTIINLPAQHPVGPVDLTIEGMVDTLSPTGLTVGMHCSAYQPWQVGTWVDDRWSSRDSTLAVDATLIDTLLSVATPGRLWTTDPAHFPFDALLGDCEQITVHSITGASSPQTWDVTRNINGFGRVHPAGSEIKLYVPAILGL